MSSGRPSRADKGKGIAKPAKPRKQPRYVLRVVPSHTELAHIQAPIPHPSSAHSAPIQAPIPHPTSVPTSSIPAMVPIPPIQAPIPQPSSTHSAPVQAPIPHPTRVPTPHHIEEHRPSPLIPPVVTTPSSSTGHIPSPSSVPSPNIGNTSDAPDSGTEGDPALHDRPMIEPVGIG